ncbi:MAG TPA: hypothetical protein VIY48_17710 [Candidatus Paceibacterota bacterium]
MLANSINGLPVNLYHVGFRIISPVQNKEVNEVDVVVTALREYANLHMLLSSELQVIAEQQSRKSEAQGTIRRADEIMDDARRNLAKLQRKLADQAINMKKYQVLNLNAE